MRRLFILGITILFLLSSCTTEETSHRKIYYTYFDTVSVISGEGMSAASFQRIAKIAEDLMVTYNQVLDKYHAYEGVINVKTINETAGGDPVEVSKELFDFLAWGVEAYEMTHGAVNMAMGSVLHLWHDAMEVGLASPTSAYVPSLADLKQASQHTDICDVVLNEENRTVQLLDPQMELDVGALGKGYCAERIAEALENEGFSGVSISLGGNIRLVGNKNGKSWTIGVQQSEDGEISCRLSVADLSVVTSGSYLRYYTCDGVRYHHIIDPKTLFPAKGFTTVTIITKNSALADVLSTALFCITVEEGKTLLSSFPETEAQWVLESGEVVATSGFAQFVK